MVHFEQCLENAFYDDCSEERRDEVLILGSGAAWKLVRGHRHVSDEHFLQNLDLYVKKLVKKLHADFDG